MVELIGAPVAPKAGVGKDVRALTAVLLLFRSPLREKAASQRRGARGMLSSMATRSRDRARLFMVCSVLALLGFHAAFLCFALGRSLLVPLLCALTFAVAAGGYAWPPIANKAAWFEAAELVGWSTQRAHHTFVALNVLTALLLVNAGIAVAVR